MKFSEGMAAIEAILFACGDPIELEKLAAAAEIEAETVAKMIDRLNDRYSEQGSAFTISRLSSSYQMTTRPEYAPQIKAAMETRRQAPLSPAALETLAIVAYNQPVTKCYIEQIRGVDCFYGINSLIEKGLLEERGRLEAPGRPRLYGTTPDFLRCFGIESLDKLPPLPKIDAPMTEEGDPQQVMNV